MDTAPAEWRVELAHALEADRDAVVEPTLARVLTELESYAAARRDQLDASIGRNLRLAAQTIRTGEVPSAEDLWEAEQATVERLGSGIPIVDIMAGFRISVSTIEDRLIELAAQRSVPGDRVLGLTRLLRQLVDAFSARVASAYRQVGVSVAVAEHRRRDRWLTDLLGGRLDPGELQHGVSLYGLARERQYVPVVSAPRDVEALEALADVLGRRRRTGPTSLLVPVDTQLVGLLPEVPDPVPGHLLAVGRPTRLESVDESFALAGRVLAAALLQSDDGVHSVDSLGWRIGVPASPELARLVSDRYLTPVRASGAFGAEVEQVLRAYLANERSIPRTATATHTHVNTVRYRLARFEELTGRPLSETDTLVELSWALQLPRPS